MDLKYGHADLILKKKLAYLHILGLEKRVVIINNV
jgi:hypothetical protein